MPCRQNAANANRSACARERAALHERLPTPASHMHSDKDCCVLFGNLLIAANGIDPHRIVEVLRGEMVFPPINLATENKKRKNLF
jgi:hypothetical protein